ncbi:MAG: type II secretion system F family protein [Gammaproteobacteria bacterium]|nr:type II secretion system F family protein [Gammaproteobacteria bacterium]
MPSFSYRALDANGLVIEGNQDAVSEHALESQLRQSGVEVLRCVEKSRGFFSRRSRVSRKDLIGFCYHMEQMTRAGLPILEALSDLRDSVDSDGFREVIGNVISAVETGNTMSQAMAEFPQVFDDVFVSLISVGEESGELPDVMLKLTESLKWQDELLAKAKTVILYPAFVGIVVVGVMLFMMLYVVPQMVDFIREMGQELPIHTRALIGFSGFLTNHWWWSIPLPGVLLLLVKFQASRSEQFRFVVDGWKLNIWYIGPIMSKLILSRFASYFALCYSSGLDVLASLRISEDIVGNAVVSKAVKGISSGIRDGKALSASIEATKMFPPLVVRMVRMGESTGLLDNALSNVSYFYDREVNEAIDRLKALIEPAMTVILGAIMAWIMLSVLGPIYETLSSIGV